MTRNKFYNSRRPLIVFDLDDTLVDTSNVYWTARSKFANALASNGLDASEIIQKFEEIDGKNMKSMGFSPDRYGKSMQETYEWFVTHSYISHSKQLEIEIKNSGDLIYSLTPDLIEGAKDLLEWCNIRFDLVLLTRGIEELQQKKLNHHNIGRYFKLIKVVSEKGTRELEDIILEAGHRLSNTWVIGDSIKSDINPAIDLGLKCILFVYAHHSYYWQQEYGISPEGCFYSIAKLTDAVQILQNPDTVERVSTLEPIK